MNFEKAQNYLQSFRDYERFMNMDYSEKDFDLDRFRSFVDQYALGYQRLKYVHVAGSKGKGTICSMLAQYLWKAGYKVALYTSPHMLKVTERFWLNGKDIDEETFVKSVLHLKDFIDEKGGCELTYFELLTVIALKLSIDEGVDYVVLEVGLGGRLDATNIIEPELAVISRIEMEHVGILGNSLVEIVREKLGIVKNGKPVLVSRQSEEAQSLIEAELLGRENVCFVESLVALQSSDLAKKENGELVFMALCILLGEVSTALFLDVFNNFKMLGRVDIRQIDGKTVVFDMAHTVSSINNLISSISGDKFVFLVSMLKGKDVSGVLSLIEKVAERIMFCSCHKERGFSGRELAEILGKGEVEEDCVLAYQKLFSELKRDQVLVITGSHFLVARILATIQ